MEKTTKETAEALAKLPPEYCTGFGGSDAVSGETSADFSKAPAADVLKNASVFSESLRRAFISLADLSVGVSNMVKAAQDSSLSFRDFSLSVRDIGAAELLTFPLSHTMTLMGIYPYASPRQWHLINHGTTKVRKKWIHALERKAARSSSNHKKQNAPH